MNGKRILITDKVHPLLHKGLENLGADVTYHPKMPYVEVQDQVSNYSGIIINSKVICDEPFLNKATHLNFIGRLGSGLDIIDLPYAEKVGIRIISSPEGNANAVGEHALGMLLSLLHNIGASHQDVQQFNWNREANRGNGILGKTIGIIGFGHTGPAFAQKLRNMGVQILAYDKYRSDYTVEFDHVRESSIEEIQHEADVISIHLPLTSETRQLIDGQWLQSCKKGMILMNTSRGGIVRSGDLLQQLEVNHVGGACLDVIENEKPETWSVDEKRTYEALLQRKEVIITPHIAGWTHQSLEKIAQILLDKIRSHFQNNG